MEWSRASSARIARTGAPWLPVLASLALTAPAHAGSGLAVTAASVEAGGLSAQGVEVVFTAHTDSVLEVTIRAGRVDGLPALGRLDRLESSCPVLVVSSGRLQCDRGRLAGEFGPAGRQDSAFGLVLAANGDLRLRVDRLAVGAGTLSLGGGLAGGA